MAGSEIYTYKLSKELVKKHDVRLFFTEHRPDREQYKMAEGIFNGLPFHESAFNHIYGSFEETYLNQGMERNLETVLDTFRPDIVHIQHLMFHSLGYPALIKSRGIPVVYTLHDYWLTCPDMRGGIRFTEDRIVCSDLSDDRCAVCVEPRLNPAADIEHRLYLINRYLIPSCISDCEWFRRAGRRVFELLRKQRASAETENNVLSELIYARKKEVLKASESVDIFIAPSEFLRQEHIRQGFDESGIVHSDYGFDKKPFQDFQRKKSENLRFAFIGTPAPHKGLHILIEAFNSLDADINAELHIYGDLGVFSDYGKEVRSLSTHEKTVFHGRFDNNSAGDVYRNIDVLVVPSMWFENSPLTIHEAFMAGIPVITSDFGGMKELVKNGKNGFLFERGNVGNLKNIMARLTADHELIRGLDLETVPVKSIEEDARWTEELYGSLLRS